MIHNAKLFDWIEDYCMNRLNQSQKEEFEDELDCNKKLRDEVKFEKDIQNAIVEKDILNLRDKLQKVAKKKKNEDEPFELLDGFDDIKQLTENMPPDELFNFYESLPKAHIYQHDISINENIHELYREQNITGNINNSDSFDIEDDIQLDGLEDAILEKDILELRETLSKVSKSVQVHYSAEEIDQYMTNELSEENLEIFKQDLVDNNALKREVNLHEDIEKAILEFDIMSLRDDLTHLMETETSWNVDEKDIEKFISEELTGDNLDEFNEELNENAGLRAEIKLRRDIEEAIGERDILELRDQLTSVKKNIEKKEIKSIIPEIKIRYINLWRYGAAVAVVLLGISGILHNNLNTTYNRYYEPAEYSPKRSVKINENILQEAKNYFDSGEYVKALSLYDMAISNAKEKYVYQFYKANSLQELEKYREAIPEYNNVIKHGDNLFIEEAEWYKALCYLKLGQKKLARKELLAVVNRKGFYSNDAKEILKKLKFSFK